MSPTGYTVDADKSGKTDNISVSGQQDKAEGVRGNESEPRDTQERLLELLTDLMVRMDRMDALQEGQYEMSRKAESQVYSALSVGKEGP